MSTGTEVLLLRSGDSGLAPIVHGADAGESAAPLADASSSSAPAVAGSGSTLSSPYGRARPHHIEYCYPHPKNSYFRMPNLLQLSKSAIKQSILKVDGAELKQKYCKTNNFEACRAGFGAKVLKNKAFLSPTV